MSAAAVGRAKGAPVPVPRDSVALPPAASGGCCGSLCPQAPAVSLPDSAGGWSRDSANAAPRIEDIALAKARAKKGNRSKASGETQTKPQTGEQRVGKEGLGHTEVNGSRTTTDRSAWNCRIPGCHGHASGYASPRLGGPVWYLEAMRMGRGSSQPSCNFSSSSAMKTKAKQTIPFPLARK